MSELDESIFEASKVRPKLTRRQKRDNCRRHNEVPSKIAALTDVSREQLSNLQKTDQTLTKIWEVMQTSLDGTSQQFFEKDGLLYRKWVPPQQNSEMEIEQLVLPERCRPGVLQLAHTIPLAGHLGKDKTVQRILHRFYWPSVYKDVAESAVSVQLAKNHHVIMPNELP